MKSVVTPVWISIGVPLWRNPGDARNEKLGFDLTGAGHALCIVNTDGNHADLNEDYASVPAGMKTQASPERTCYEVCTDPGLHETSSRRGRTNFRYR